MQSKPDIQLSASNQLTGESNLDLEKRKTADNAESSDDEYVTKSVIPDIIDLTQLASATEEEMNEMRRFFYRAPENGLYYSDVSNLIQTELDLDTKHSNILEYMVLEKAKVLGSFKNTALLCKTKPNDTSNQLFIDGERRSLLIFGFNRDAGEDEILKLKRINEGIAYYFATSSQDVEGDLAYKTLGIQCSFILTNSSLEDAVKSSSLLKANRNIENLSLQELEELKKNILLYKINDHDLKLSALIDKLTMKIDKCLSKHSNLPSTPQEENEESHSGNAHSIQLQSSIINPHAMFSSSAPKRPREAEPLPENQKKLKEIDDKKSSLQNP